MGQGIWIFEEHDLHGTKNITLELLSEGQKLAGRLKEELCVCLIGHKVEGMIPSLTEFGAAKAYLLENELLADYNLDAYSFILGEMIKEYQPSILMMGATAFGSELAPRIAARFGLPCITEVKKIAGGSENFQITKSGYNDQLYVEVRPVTKRPLVITLPPGETDISKSNESRETVIIRKEFDLPEEIKRTKYKRFIKGDPRTIRVDEANVIVAVGNGVDSESLPFVQELADVMGASIGGTRVAVDKRLIPFERQIGITGKSVIPKLLVACGISGSREFTDGMQDSKEVIAINQDRNARIFKFANLCINGDLRKIIPQVIDQIRIAKQNREKGKDPGRDTKS